MTSAVVVDLGSCTVKCGHSHSFLTETQPGVLSSSWVQSEQPVVAGQASAAPIQAVRQGQIADWAAVECILYDALYLKLGWELGEEGSLLIAEPLLTPRVQRSELQSLRSSVFADREQLAQLAFEVFNVTGLYFADQAALALYSTGKSTGLVVDIGHEKTDVAVVVDGQLYLPSVRRLPAGGRQVTERLRQLLAARGLQINDAAVLQGLKEACMDAEDGGGEAQEPKALPPFRLPDGQLISVRAEEAAELASCMLQPALMGVSCPSVVETAAASVFTHLDPAVRKAALDSVVVCGGGSAVPGLGQRLCRELRQMLPPSMPPCAVSVPEYMPATTLQYAPWMGGAVLAKILMQHNHYMSKGDYEELGPAIVHRKVGL